MDTILFSLRPTDSNRQGTCVMAVSPLNKPLHFGLILYVPSYTRLDGQREGFVIVEKESPDHFVYCANPALPKQESFIKRQSPQAAAFIQSQWAEVNQALLQKLKARTEANTPIDYQTELLKLKAGLQQVAEAVFSEPTTANQSWLKHFKSDLDSMKQLRIDYDASKNQCQVFSVGEYPLLEQMEYLKNAPPPDPLKQLEQQARQMFSALQMEQQNQPRQTGESNHPKQASSWLRWCNPCCCFFQGFGNVLKGLMP